MNALSRAALGGPAWLAGGALTLGLHAVLAGGLFALGLAAATHARDEAESEPSRRLLKTVDVEFVRLGQKLPPRKLPNRRMPQASTAPDLTGVAVSKNPRRERPDAGPMPTLAEADLLTRLGNRAETLSKLTLAYDQEGDPEGIEDGTATADEGDLYLTKLKRFFRAGWVVPSTLTDAERRSLRANVEVDITQEGTVGTYRLTRESGNVEYDHAVRLRMEQALGAPLPQPVPEEFLGATVPIGFVPPR